MSAKKKSALDATRPDPGSLRVSGTGFYDDGTRLIVDIQLRNSSTRTLHAYATARNIQYDSAARTLKVLLSDRETDEMESSMFIRPRFVPVDPNGETTITLRLPRFLTRMIPGKDMPAPKLEKLQISGATSIQVEVDWSDTPFYSDPRGQKTVRQQLVDWAKSTARQQGSRREPPPTKLVT